MTIDEIEIDPHQNAPQLANGAIVLEHSYRQERNPIHGKVLAFTNGEYVTWCITLNGQGTWDATWPHNFGRNLDRAHRDFIARSI